VPLFLRLTGITNAALWFGATILWLGAVWPAFSSAEMMKILPPSHAGAAAHIVLDRCLKVQCWCGGIGLAHLLADRLYTGKPWRRGVLILVLGLFALGLFNSVSAAPRLKRLHYEIYGLRSTPVQREQARHSLGVWQGLLRFAGVLEAAGLWAYVWQLNRTENAGYATVGKFRG
jgi:hypothetical protein